MLGGVQAFEFSFGEDDCLMEHLQPATWVFKRVIAGRKLGKLRICLSQLALCEVVSHLLGMSDDVCNLSLFWRICPPEFFSHQNPLSIFTTPTPEQ